MQANIARAQNAFNRNVQSGLYGAGNHVRRGPAALQATNELIMMLPIGVPRTIVEPGDKPARIAFYRQLKQVNYPNTSSMSGFIAMLGDMTETVENPLQDNISLRVFPIAEFGLMLQFADLELDGAANGPMYLTNTIEINFPVVDASNLMLGISVRDNNYPAYFKPSVGALLANLMVRFLLDPERSAPGPIAAWLMDIRDETQTDGIQPRLQYGATARHCLEWLSLFLQADPARVNHLVCR
jgi:hypothetical protein